MNRSMPGLPVHYQLPKFTQTHAHWVGDAIQPSHPLSSPSPPAPNPSQHQGRFQWVSSSHEVAKVLEFQLQHQSFQWTPRTDLLVPGKCWSAFYPYRLVWILKKFMQMKYYHMSSFITLILRLITVMASFYSPTPWTAAHHASLCLTISWSLLKLRSIELEMPSNCLILCCLLLLPSIFPSIRVFSESYTIICLCHNFFFWPLFFNPLTCSWKLEQFPIFGFDRKISYQHYEEVFVWKYGFISLG